MSHDRLPYATELLHKMADLFAERNAVYKDNFRMVGKIMQAMFPEGLELKTPEEHNKFHLFMLAIVKLTRYAINYKEGHKDSLEDMIVYLSMVAALDYEASRRIIGWRSSGPGEMTPIYENEMQFGSGGAGGGPSPEPANETEQQG